MDMNEDRQEPINYIELAINFISMSYYPYYPYSSLYYPSRYLPSSYYYPYYPTYYPYAYESALRRSRIEADIAESRLRRSRVEADIAVESALRRSRVEDSLRRSRVEA